MKDKSIKNDFRNESITIMLSAGEKEAFCHYCETRGGGRSDTGRMILKEYMEMREIWRELEAIGEKSSRSIDDWMMITDLWFNRFMVEYDLRKKLLAFCRDKGITIPVELKKKYNRRKK